MINVALPGVNGRMGQELAALLQMDKDLMLAVPTVRANNHLVDTFYPGTKTIVRDNSVLSYEQFDILIDFTLPDALQHHLDACVIQNKPILIGSTGLASEHMAAIQSASKFIPVFYSANMSVGISIVNQLIKDIGQMVDKNDWQVSMHEIHHTNKKDGPSGTLLALEKTVKKLFNPKYIEKSFDRVGAVVGEHQIAFKNLLETIEIKHTAHDRSVFAKGALVAAKWLVKQPPGLYKMSDMLFKKETQLA